MDLAILLTRPDSTSVALITELRLYPTTSRLSNLRSDLYLNNSGDG